MTDRSQGAHNGALHLFLGAGKEARDIRKLRVFLMAATVSRADSATGSARIEEVAVEYLEVFFCSSHAAKIRVS